MGHELSLSPLHIYVSRTLDMNYTHGAPLLDGRMKVLRYNTNFHELSLSPTRIYASRTLDMHYTHGAPILDGRVKILRCHTNFHVQIKFYASPHTLRKKKKYESRTLYELQTTSRTIHDSRTIASLQFHVHNRIYASPHSHKNKPPDKKKQRHTNTYTLTAIQFYNGHVQIFEMYGISRLLKIIGLFCRISSLL